MRPDERIDLRLKRIAELEKALKDIATDSRRLSVYHGGETWNGLVCRLQQIAKEALTQHAEPSVPSLLELADELGKVTAGYCKIEDLIAYKRLRAALEKP